jgi:hypothetical protein
VFEEGDPDDKPDQIHHCVCTVDFYQRLDGTGAAAFDPEL